VRDGIRKPHQTLAATLVAVALLALVGGCGKGQEPQTADDGDFEEHPVGFSAIPDAKPFYGPAPFTSEFSVDVKNAKGAVKILWDFNDGSPRTTEASPKHTFPKPGQYTVGVQVTDSDGEIDGGSVIVRSMTDEEWKGLQAKRRAAGITVDD
jgi:hypothetical protein